MFEGANVRHECRKKNKNISTSHSCIIYSQEGITNSAKRIKVENR